MSEHRERAVRGERVMGDRIRTVRKRERRGNEKLSILSGRNRLLRHVH